MQWENCADVFSLTASLAVTIHLGDTDHESKGRIRLRAFSHFKQRGEKGKAKQTKVFFAEQNRQLTVIEALPVTA